MATGATTTAVRRRGPLRRRSDASASSWAAISPHPDPGRARATVPNLPRARWSSSSSTASHVVEVVETAPALQVLRGEGRFRVTVGRSLTSRPASGGVALDQFMVRGLARARGSRSHPWTRTHGGRARRDHGGRGAFLVARDRCGRGSGRPGWRRVHPVLKATGFVEHHRARPARGGSGSIVSCRVSTGSTGEGWVGLDRVVVVVSTGSTTAGSTSGGLGGDAPGCSGSTDRRRIGSARGTGVLGCGRRGGGRVGVQARGGGRPPRRSALENLQVASQTATKVAAVGAEVVVGGRGAGCPARGPARPEARTHPTRRPPPTPRRSGYPRRRPRRPPHRDLTSGT